MKQLRSADRSERVAKGIFFALVCGAISFFFVHGVWAEVLQKTYLLTICLSFALLWGYWESVAERWFWKVMVAIVIVHTGILFVIARINLQFPEIDRVPRVAYGILSLVLAGEVLAARSLIEAHRPHDRRSRDARKVAK